MPSYVPGVVKLLLLLSALLSALTGVQGGARAAPVPVAVNQIVRTARPASVAPAAASGRPTTTGLDDAAMRRAIVRPVWRLAAMAPLYLSRRRE